MRSTEEDQAETLIRATGARLTKPRTRVLAFLIRDGGTLTHQEIHDRLDGEPVDAVTLYRVLEWLTANGLLHRITAANGVWRFTAHAGGQGHEHAHFQCTRCDSMTCLDDMPLPAQVNMPAGFTREEMDFLIKGLCARCSRKPRR